jgi:hypothetical protein
MPPAPLSVKAQSAARDRAGMTTSAAPAPLTDGPARRRLQGLLLLRRAGRPGQTVVPAPACPEGTSGARPEMRRNRLPRIRSLLPQRPRAARSCRDPLFAHPDRVENDYYRFQKYPHD